MKVEVEGKEGFIENSFGDRAIIPKDKWGEVQKMIDEGCYDCVDRFVANLPKYSDYADKGSIIPSDQRSPSGGSEVPEVGDLSLEGLNSPQIVDPTLEQDKIGAIGNTFSYYQGEELKNYQDEQAKKARYEEWLNRMQPPTSNVPIGEELKEKALFWKPLARDVAIAVGGAAALQLAAPQIIGGLGGPTLGQTLGATGLGMTGAIGIDSFYQEAGGQFAGDALKIENPYGRMALNAISPGLLAGGVSSINTTFKNNFADDFISKAKEIFGDHYDPIFNYEQKRGSLKDVITAINDEITKNISLINKQEGRIYNQKNISGKITELLDKQDRLLNLRELASEFYLKDKNTIATTIAGEPVNFGEKEIINFVTGKKHKAIVNLPGKIAEYSKPINDEYSIIPKITESRDGLFINQEYVSTIKENIKYIETKFNGKVFGSSKGVAEGGMHHLTDDFDVLITQKDYESKVLNKYKHRGDTKFSKKHSISEEFGKQGDIDFVIIGEKNGLASGEIANQLFRQFDPKRYYEAVKVSIKTKSELIIPYTPENLLAIVDPIKKTILDAYEAGYRNPKHINRIDHYIKYGNPDKVIEAQQAYINQINPKNGKLAPSFKFDDFFDNVELLQLMGYNNMPESVVYDPKRMQAILNDWYINNSVLSRGVSGDELNDIIDSFTRWDPVKSRGGNFYGAGLNTVMHGESGYGSIYGNVQLSLNTNASSPDEFVKLINKQTKGAIPFTNSEAEIANGLLKKYGIQGDYVKSPEEFITSFKGHRKSQEILNEFTDKTGIRSVGTTTFSNRATYSSLSKEIDNAIEEFTFSLREYSSLIPKSLEMRQMNAKEKYATTISVKAFYRTKSVLEKGLSSLEIRINKIDQELNSIRNNRSIIESNAILTKLRNEQAELIMREAKVRSQLQKLDKLHNKYADVFYAAELTAKALSGGAGTVFALNYALNNTDVRRFSHSGRKQLEMEKKEKLKTKDKQ